MVVATVLSTGSPQARQSSTPLSSTPRCNTATTSNRLSGLSARELEVLHLLAQGLTDRGICDQLVLSPKTVASHVRHIFAKLAIPGSDHDNRRVHAVLVYLNDITASLPGRRQRPAKTTDTNVGAGAFTNRAPVE